MDLVSDKLATSSLRTQDEPTGEVHGPNGGPRHGFSLQFQVILGYFEPKFHGFGHKWTLQKQDIFENIFLLCKNNNLNNSPYKLGNTYSYRFKFQPNNILLFNIIYLKSWVQELLVADEAISSKEAYSDRLDPPVRIGM